MREYPPGSKLRPFAISAGPAGVSARLLPTCLLLIAAMLVASDARAARNIAETAALCDDAAAHAAAKRQVPLPVLRALTLTETGRKLDGANRAWPWTVNMEGAGVWFDAPDEALAYVRNHHKRGARSFDVGCFQINYKWHGEAFPSVEAMFDPAANADYAAQFIRALYEELGDWSKAAGAYHSRTPEFAGKYRKRFDRILAALGPPPMAVPDASGHDSTAIRVAASERTQDEPLAGRLRGPLIRFAATIPGAPGSVFATIGPPSAAHAPVGLLRAARPLFD